MDKNKHWLATAKHRSFPLIQVGFDHPIKSVSEAARRLFEKYKANGGMVSTQPRGSDEQDWLYGAGYTVIDVVEKSDPPSISGGA